MSLRDNKKLLSEVEISFKDVCKSLNNPTTFQLQPTKEGISATLTASFSLKGPSSQLCPICSIFLGIFTNFSLSKHYRMCGLNCLSSSEISLQLYNMR